MLRLLEDTGQEVPSLPCLQEQQRLTFRTSLLRYDVDWRLLLTRASIWKRGGAASSVAASQLCCRHPQQTPSWRSPRATAAGWLWDNVVAAALAPFPDEQLSVCSLSGDGTLGCVASEAGPVNFHAAPEPTVSPGYASSAGSALCGAGQGKLARRSRG